MLRKQVILAALATCVISASWASADFVSVTVEQNTDPLATGAGLFVCDLYASFDAPTDKVLGLVFSSVSASAGAFHQDAAGGDTAPDALAVSMNPALAFDSFVTVGVEIDDGTDTTQVTPDFDPDLFNNSGQLVGDWFNADPDNGNGVPDGSGRVFIGRLTLSNPTPGDAISGILTVGWEANESNDFIVDEVTIQHVVPAVCPADLTGDNLVDASDLAQLLGAWGPNPGDPADLTGDDIVDASDLAQLLGAWGPCPA